LVIELLPEYAVLIAIFIIGIILGMGFGFFMRKVFRFFLFFLGYTVLVLVFLWLIGVLPVNLIAAKMMDLISRIHFSIGGGGSILERIKDVLSERAVIGLLGGLIGVILGWKEGG